MFTVQLTPTFQSWLDGLRDVRAQVSIARRIDRISAGNFGDVKPVGEGVSELRVDVGPGCRVYFVQRGGHWVQRRFEMTEKLLPFDMARYLGSDEAIAEYLTQVLADGDSDELLSAIGHIAKAKGMAQVAKDAGLGRESLYKALAPGAKPRFDTILRVARALGVTLIATPAHV